VDTAAWLLDLLAKLGREEDAPIDIELPPLE